MMTQRTAITSAITMARTAVTGVNNDSTDSEVSSADAAIAALKKAIADAEDLSDGDADVVTARTTLATLEPLLAAAKTRRTEAMTAAMEEEDEEEREANKKLGKDLHAALDGPAAADTTVLDNAAVTLLATGLTVDAAAGAGALPNTGDDSDPASVTLKAGDSAGSLNGWAGTNFAHTNTGTKVVNEAVVYTNKGPGETVSFSDRGTTLATENAGTAPAFTAIKGYLERGQYRRPLVLLRRGSWPTPSRIREPKATLLTVIRVSSQPEVPTTVHRVCTAAQGTCASTNDDGKGSPGSLAGTWHFKPDAGANAMAHDPDGTYLYYGWWLTKDKDGVPKAASAFTGVVGDGASIQGGATALATNPNALGGSATYVGHVGRQVRHEQPARRHRQRWPLHGGTLP